MFIKKWKRSPGFSLLELLVAVGLLGGVGVTASIFFSRQQNTVKQVEANLYMTNIARAVERALVRPDAIRASADLSSQPGNIALKNCITATMVAKNNGTSCTATDPTQQLSFDLILPFIQENPSTPTIPTLAQIESNTVAGQDSNPILYRIIDGNPCPRGTNSPECNITVKAYFWATCPPNQITSATTPQSITQGTLPTGVQNITGTNSLTPTACYAAQTINLRFQVAYVPSASSSIKTPIHVKNIPDDKLFWMSGPGGYTSSGFGAFAVPVQTIPVSGLAPLICPANATMTGIVNGVPTCECKYPFQAAPGCVPGEPCACIDVPKKCTGDTRYRGIDLNGNIICCPVYCQDVLVDSTGSVQGCNLGGWIESITPSFFPLSKPGVTSTSSCGAVHDCSIGKWGGSCTTPIKCVDTYKCCYEYGGTTGTGCNGGQMF